MIGMTGVLLRQVPADLISRVAAGELEVLGSIVRSVSGGRIVGHLQETSLLSRVLLDLPTSVPGLLGDAVQVMQNEQIKSAIEVVRSLQMTNILFSAASVGVSLAGTALVLDRVSKLEGKVDAMSEQLTRISAGIRELKEDRIGEDFSRLKSLSEQFEESWDLGNPEREWAEIAREGHFLAGNFERRSRGVQLGDVADLNSLPFIEAFAMASATRVAARVACGDLKVAQDAASASASTLRDLGKPLQVGVLVMVGMEEFCADQGTPAWAARLEDERERVGSLLAPVRNRELCAATSIATIAHLRETDASGREWLRSARGNDDSPLVYLSVEQAP